MDRKARSQIDKFKDMARELECDENEDRFESALRRVASHKPEKKIKPKKG